MPADDPHGSVPDEREIEAVARTLRRFRPVVDPELVAKAIVNTLDRVRRAPGPSSEDHRSLTAKVADELRRNDECGTGPLSDDEYMDDAAAILRIVAAHGATRASAPQN